MSWRSSNKRKPNLNVPTAYKMGYSGHYASEQPKNNRKFGLVIILGGTVLVLVLARLVFINVQQSVNAEQPNIFGIKISTEKSRLAEAKAKSSTELNTILQTFAQPYGNKVNAIIIDTSTGGSASVNADKPIVSASLYKLFVAYAVYKKVDDGTLSLNTSLAKYGMNKSISQCLDPMITVSDNDCGVALGELIGWDKIDTLLAANGYTATTLNNYLTNGELNGKDKKTSAQDVATLLNKLYSGELLQPKTTKLFIDLLKAQKVNKYLPTGLPKNTILAHKTGDLYGFIHDAGILYSADKNIIIVLMSGEWNTPAKDAPPVFAKLSKAVYDYAQTIY